MTTPPDDSPYESDIRANTSTGLGGLFAQLSAIAAGIGALPQLLIEVQAIRTRLETDMPVLLQRLAWLSGTTAPNTASYAAGGLPSYLPAVLGIRAGTGAANVSAALSLLESNGRLTSIAQALAGQDVLVPGDNILVSVDEHLNALRGFSNEQSSVLGFIGDEPAGVSIKAILQAQLECCEDGGTVEPPPDEPPANALPAVAGTCAEDRQGPFQCTGFFRLNPPEITPAIFGLKFDGLEAVSTWFAVQDGVYGASFLHYESATDKQVCLVWDLTGNPQPSQGGYVIDGDNPPVWSSGNATVFNVTTNGPASFFDSTLSSGVAFYVRLVLDDPALLPNYRNFWLYWSEAPV